MDDNGYTCNDYSVSGMLDTKCNVNSWWAKNAYCQYSCYLLGLGYEGVPCCLLDGDALPPSPPASSPPPSPPPTTPAECSPCTDTPSNFLTNKGLSCAEYINLGRGCLQANWISNKLCQQSCYDEGHGYDGDVCDCVAPPPPPPAASSTFATADADGDGCISEEEWAAAGL
tara:strand:- start:147 stop:659 length:513 start_codon:yes stop_codon:yes gene_type:complete